MAAEIDYSPVDYAKGRLIAQRLGQPADHTPDEWLEEAIRYEQFYAQVGPFDPSAEHLIQRQADCLAAGILAEKYPGVIYA